ncbi:hypothetical protein [uncultured Cloacibacillus sp.]|uniref:hypothetical protein n=1 Tax=uncultured Cloacibacillus sp. TaxID=889794 RepID=UPI003208DB26
MEEWSKRLPDILAQKINEILIRHGNRYDQQIQALYQLLLTRIDEYNSVKVDELDLNSFESSSRMSSPLWDCEYIFYINKGKQTVQ